MLLTLTLIFGVDGTLPLALDRAADVSVLNTIEF